MEKRDLNFFINENDNFKIIQFQKSQDSAKHMIKFTINLGVSYGEIRKNDGELDKIPSYLDCHWQRRIGHFLNGDKWWLIKPETSVDLLKIEIEKIILEVAFPFLNEQCNIKDLSDLQ